MQLTIVGFTTSAEFISEFHNAGAAVTKQINFPVAFPAAEAVQIVQSPTGFSIGNDGDSVTFAVGQVYTYLFELVQKPDVGPTPSYELQV